MGMGEGTRNLRITGFAPEGTSQPQAIDHGSDAFGEACTLFLVGRSIKNNKPLGLNVLGPEEIIRNAGASLCWKQCACRP
jgi:hypothetical protein